MERASGQPGLSRSARWVMAIYFVSGCCSLIDEVIWVRLLKLTLGNTVYATTVVVSVFLGGLALGALLMSRRADRIADPLKWYAILELVVTVAALCVPWALGAVDRIYVWFFRSFEPGRPWLLLVQVLLSAATILVPSMTMGSTLPLLGKFVTALERDTGRLVGRLYALNTLGGALGCFLAGFVLIRFFGVMGALYIAALLNLAVSGAAWTLRRRHPGAASSPAAAPAGGPPAAPRDVAFGLLVAAFFFSGFVSLGYEICWIRSVMYLLGGDTYVFSSVLTVYLLGNVVGAAIGSRLASRLQNPANGFALTLALLGLSGLVYMPTLLWWTARLMGSLKGSLEPLYAGIGIPSALVEPLAQSLVLFLLPALLMGIGFPLALQTWTNHVRQVGRSTGSAYGANTVGAVLGGIVTGFALIPLWGVQTTITSLGLGAVLTAAALHLAFAGAGVWRRAVTVGTAMVLLVVGVLLAPGDLLWALMERSPWLNEKLETLSVIEGTTATVSVHRNPERGTLHLYASGQSIAGDTYALRGDQKALGHFGLLLNPGARTVLSVGFGSGETTKCLSFHSPEIIDCVEIAPEVVQSSLGHFQHLNLGSRVHDLVNLIYMDAKNYLHLTDRKYDVIVNDSIHPRNFSENASLYGKEYFVSARSRLNPGGLFVSWLPTYQMSIGLFDSIIGTMLESFPHVTLWYLSQNPAPLVLLIGSEAEQRYSPDEIDRALEDPRIRESLAVIGIHDSIDLLNCYVGDERDLAPRVAGYAVNSDHRPYVEFNTDSWTSLREMYRHYVLEIRSATVLEHLDLSGLDAEQREAWLVTFRTRHEATDYLLRSYQTSNALERLKLIMDGLSIVPGDRALLKARDQADDVLLLKGMNVLNEASTSRALELADVILRIDTQAASAWLLRARAMQREGDLARALFAARMALELDPGNDEARSEVQELSARLAAAGGAYGSGVEGDERPDGRR